MSQPEKKEQLKKAVKLVKALNGAIQKSRDKRKLRKAAKKARRKDRMYKLKGKVDEFMKAAFEPKSAKTARRKKIKMERKQQKAI